MADRETSPVSELNFSMQNLLGQSTLYALLLPIGYQAGIARRAGYNGIEAFPSRLPPDVQMRTGRMTQSTARAIRSVHQSHLLEKTLAEALRQKNRVWSLLNYLIQPPHR